MICVHIPKFEVSQLHSSVLKRSPTEYKTAFITVKIKYNCDGKAGVNHYFPVSHDPSEIIMMI